MTAAKAWHVTTGASEVGDEVTALCGQTFTRSAINRKYACRPCLEALLKEHTAMARALDRVADMVNDVDAILGAVE